MIKVNELRIGNNILLLGEVCTIECISNLPKRKEMYWIKTKEFIDTKIIHFKPIPLTEEILLKCGFELTDVKTHSDNRPLTKMFYKKTLLVQHHDNGLWSFIIMGYNIVRPEMSQFLHQLQNIYFALTNEELLFNNDNSSK